MLSGYVHYSSQLLECRVVLPRMEKHDPGHGHRLE